MQYEYMAYICCNDYLLLIGLCKTVEEGNYMVIISLNEIIGWKYEKKWKKLYVAFMN